MTKVDKEKYKEIHVQQDFFQEIISGFQNSQQKVDIKAKMPNVMPSKQSYFFRTKTLPLIMKSVQKQNLLKEWIIATSQRLKKIQEDSIKTHYFSFLQNKKQMQNTLDDQLSEVEDDQKAKNGSFAQIRKLYSHYKRLKTYYRRVMSCVLMFQSLKQKFQNDSERDYTNQYSRNEIESKINDDVYQKQNQVVSAFKASVYPPVKQLNAMINQKMAGSWTTFFGWLVEKVFLPDWGDPVDVTLWALSLAAGVFTAGAAASLGIISRASKFLRLFFVLRGTLKRVRRNIEKGDWEGAARNLALGLTNLSIIKNGNKLIKASRYAAQTYYWTNAIVTAVDLYDIEDEDVTEMTEYYKGKSKKWGEKTQASLVSKIRKSTSDLVWVEKVVLQTANELQKGVRSLLTSSGEEAMLGLQKYYKSKIIIKGQDIQIKDNNEGAIITVKQIIETLTHVSHRINKKLIQPFILQIKKQNSKYDNFKSTFRDECKEKINNGIKELREFFKNGGRYNFSIDRDGDPTLQLNDEEGYYEKSISFSTNAFLTTWRRHSSKRREQLRKKLKEGKQRHVITFEGQHVRKQLKINGGDLQGTWKFLELNENNNNLTFFVPVGDNQGYIYDAPLFTLIITDGDIDDDGNVMPKTISLKLARTEGIILKDSQGQFERVNLSTFDTYNRTKFKEIQSTTWYINDPNALQQFFRYVIYDLYYLSYRANYKAVMGKQFSENSKIFLSKVWRDNLRKMLKRQLRQINAETDFIKNTEKQQRCIDSLLNYMKQQQEYASKNSENTFFEVPQKLTLYGEGGSLSYLGHFFKFSEMMSYNLRFNYKYDDDVRDVKGGADWWKHVYFTKKNPNDKVDYFLSGKWSKYGQGYDQQNNKLDTIGVWLNFKELYKFQGKYTWEYGFQILSNQKSIKDSQVKMNNVLVEIENTLNGKFGAL